MSEKHYFFECGLGAGIRLAKDARQARSRILKEIGTNGLPISCLRVATDYDFAHVRGMGGYIPPTPTDEEVK